MSRPTIARAVLDIRHGADPPEGVLTDATGRERRFHGWIELAAAIEEWRRLAPIGSPTTTRGELR